MSSSGNVLSVVEGVMSSSTVGNGSSVDMDELNDADGLISGVFGAVIVLPSGYVVREDDGPPPSAAPSVLSDPVPASVDSPGRCFRIRMRTA